MLNRSNLSPRLIRYTQMTPKEWEAVPDNPRQRDTVLHAKKVISHFLTPQPTHPLVAMAVCPDGSRWKLDGHTRCHLWKTGAVPVPDELEVMMIDVPSREAAIEAYDLFDNARAAERGPDVMQGAFRANGLVDLKSHMLRSGRVNTALRRLFRLVAGDQYEDLWHYGTMYEAVRRFAGEIRVLDDLQPVPKLFPPGIQMAVLITLRNDYHTSIEFWRLYAKQHGTKDGTKMDAVQALIEAVMVAKSKNRAAMDVTGDLFGKSIAAFLSFQIGSTYVVGGSGVRSVSEPTLKKYIHQRRAR